MLQRTASPHDNDGGHDHQPLDRDMANAELRSTMICPRASAAAVTAAKPPLTRATAPRHQLPSVRLLATWVVAALAAKIEWSSAELNVKNVSNGLYGLHSFHCGLWSGL